MQSPRVTAGLVRARRGAGVRGERGHAVRAGFVSARALQGGLYARGGARACAAGEDMRYARGL